MKRPLFAMLFPLAAFLFTPQPGMAVMERPDAVAENVHRSAAYDCGKRHSFKSGLKRLRKTMKHRRSHASDPESSGAIKSIVFVGLLALIFLLLTLTILLAAEEFIGFLGIGLFLLCLLGCLGLLFLCFRELRRHIRRLKKHHKQMQTR
ncbi:MAG: hypothetical protein KDC70_12520 [Saprospiraceae bacterium]|nr:hypothetical protein [Saprospiraceae bacterium]